MRPHLKRRVARMLGHDTSFARLIVATGLLLLGAGMTLGMGQGAAGYVLLEAAMSIQFWGIAYMLAGLAGMWGAITRLCFWWRVALSCLGIYLWSLIALAQFADQLLPTRLLLILPAIVELWVLIKVVVQGKRGAPC
jgi:hypothetical protein